MLRDHGDLLGRVGGEVVDRDHARLLELADVLDVLLEVLEPALDRRRRPARRRRRSGTPPCILSARTVATSTVQHGAKPP